MAPNTSGNEQLKPRSSRSFFPDSMLLLGQDQFQSTINEWWASNSAMPVAMIHYRYGTSSQVWIMLYRGSRDGFSAKQFHEKCDEKGPTLTLVKVTSYGVICSNIKVTYSQLMVTYLEATLTHPGPADTRKEDILAHKSKHEMCSVCV